MSGLVNEQAFEGRLLLITSRIGQKAYGQSNGCCSEFLSPFTPRHNAFL